MYDRDRCIEYSVEDDFGYLMGQLSDNEVEEAVRIAADRFFNHRIPGLKGRYTVLDMSLNSGESTDDELRADAQMVGIDPSVYQDHWKQMFLEWLNEVFDEELFESLQRSVSRKRLDGEEVVDVYIQEDNVGHLEKFEGDVECHERNETPQPRSHRKRHEQ